MRKSILIICVVVLTFCLWLLLHRTASTKNSPLEIQASQTNQTLTNQASQVSQPKVVENLKTASIPSVTEVPRRPTLADITNRQQQALADWQAPIEFYGKVVDENTNLVAGASVTFKWVETPSEEGNRTSQTHSDAEGLFSLQNAKGPDLTVLVSKNGYYTSRSTPDSFRYSLGNEKFHANPQNPVIFSLRKKGQGVELITSENGMRPNVWVRIPKDNTPVRVDLLEKKPSATGQLEISQIKPPFQGATNWSFRMSIPDGGLIENQDEFQFAAPESGYQPTVEYDFAKGETNWITQVSKQFYIAFGQPRKYGWLRIESNLAQETIFLTYAINPDGSRNLEPIQ